MSLKSKTVFGMGLLAIVAGCNTDKPHEYGEQRPDINQLDENDRGLQSKDVEAATAQIIQQLMALPALNASKTQWTLAVSDMTDNTVSREAINYRVFMDSVRTAISEKGQGRITLIENRDVYHNLQNKELEGPAPDPYGQGGRAGAPGGAGTQPDYILYGTAEDLPNRSTNSYYLIFTITNTHTRVQEFSRRYSVKVQR